jgi:RsiW-degrading membrane proteinase PrsW (M82 family)
MTLPLPTGSANPLDRWPMLRRVSWLVILILGVLTYLWVLHAMVDTRNINFFPSLLLIGAITVPLSVLAFAEGGGRRIAVAPWVLITAAVAGGIVGTITAGVLEYDSLTTLGFQSMIVVGLVEEAAKLLVPFGLYLVLRPNESRGGVVVGIASGMGFATLETMGYGFQALLVAGSIGAVDQTLLLRALLSPASHVAWTGLTTAALWRIRTAPRRGRAIVRFALVYLVAVALHTTWDAMSSVPSHIVVAALSFTALLILVHRAHRTGPGPARIAEPAIEAAASE